MSRQAHILDFEAVRARNAGLGPARASARGQARQAQAARAARRSRREGFGWASLRRDQAAEWERAGYGYDACGPDDASLWRNPEASGLRRGFGADAVPSADGSDGNQGQDGEEGMPLSRAGRREARRRGRQKRRAERAYGRAVDASAQQQDSGPRAALFEMRMGLGHRRAASKAGSASASSAPGRRRALRGILPQSVALRVLAGLAACLVAVAVFLYPAAQNYYVAKRDLAKAQVAYQTVQERNAILEADVAALETPEGIEDRARQEYGWVREGENAVTVTGRAGRDDGAKRIEDLPAVETVQAPQTWYSDVLDPLFGYAG